MDDRSIGCGLCAEMCPEVFEMGQDELAHVKADPVPAEAEQTCQTAADDCPVGAIKIER